MSLNIKQISNFQLKSLRIAGFIEYIQQAAKLFKTFRESGEEGQSQLPEKVEAVYTPFVTGVTAVDDAYKQSRASDYTQKIADEDMRRDNLYKLLVTYLKTYLKFTFDAEKKEADQAYRDLVLALNASVVMDENPTRFDDLVSQVNELIKYYRLYVVPKGGKKDDEESEEGGSTNDIGNTSDAGENNGGSSSGGDDANQ